LKKITAVFLTVLLLAFSAAPAFAKSEARYLAEKDAESAESMYKFLFFGAGCLLGPVGLLLGYTVIPPVPENRIMGKTSAYVAEYVSVYTDQVRNTQGQASLYGCSISVSLASLAAFLIYSASMQKNFNRM
jgi:hypothetical protein